MWRKEIRATPYSTLTGLIFCKKWNHISTSNVTGKAKQKGKHTYEPSHTKQNGNHPISSYLFPPAPYGSNSTSKVAQSWEWLLTFILEKQDERPIPSSAISPGRTLWDTTSGALSPFFSLILPPTRLSTANYLLLQNHHISNPGSKSMQVLFFVVFSGFCFVLN